MSYQVAIKNNQTGEVRMYQMSFAWRNGNEDPSTPWSGDIYTWTEGNFGCECNLHLFFCRAKGEYEDEPYYDAEGNEINRCGNGEYTALYALLPDGSIKDIQQYADWLAGNKYEPRTSPEQFK